MPRLFTAIWPPRPVVTELSAALRSDEGWPPLGWRAIPPRRWHLTLCFHGEADPGVLARELDSRAASAEAPWLRLADQVRFRQVIAVGVEAGGRLGSAALDALVIACGADTADYRAHVTVARTPRRSDAPPPGGPLAGFVGEWWRVGEVCLVRSELVSGGPRYTVLHRVALRVDPSAAAPQNGSLTARCPGGL